MAKKTPPVGGSAHILKSFDKLLARMRDELLEIGGLVEQQLLFCRELLEGSGDDSSSMQALRQREIRINELDLEISRLLVNCLTMHQPMAIDARCCVSYMRISLDLERIGDELEHVAESLVSLRGSAALGGPLGEVLGRLLNSCGGALARALGALSTGDSAQARQVIDRDREINTQQIDLQRQVMDALAAGNQDVASGFQLIWAARSLERIGDHAKNLSQAVIFVATGEDLRDREIEQKASPDRRKGS